MPTFYEFQQFQNHPDHGSVRSLRRRATQGYIVDHAIPEPSTITQRPPRYTLLEDGTRYPPLVVRVRVGECPSGFPPDYSEYPSRRQDSCVEVPWNAGRTRQHSGSRSTSYSSSRDAESMYKCEREPRKPYDCVISGEILLYQWLRAVRKAGDGIDGEIRYYFIHDGAAHLSSPTKAAIETLKACLTVARLREEEAVLLCKVVLGTLYMQDRFEDNRSWRNLNSMAMRQTQEFLTRVVKAEREECEAEKSNPPNEETYSMHLRNLMPYVFQLDYSSDTLWPVLSNSEFFETHYTTAKALSCFVDCLKSSNLLSKGEIRALVKFIRHRISDPKIKIYYGAVPDQGRNSAEISGNTPAIAIFLYRYYSLVTSEGAHFEGAVPYPELTRVRRGYNAVEGLLRFDHDYLMPLLPVDKKERPGFQKKWNHTRKRYFSSWPEEVEKGQKKYEYNESLKESLADKYLMRFSKKFGKLKKVRR